jgi:hypothetical protein
MTYGKKENISEIKNSLQESGFNFNILEKWLTNNELAEIRVFTDILLQLQITDQFSGAMQESLYAGNILITGSWLPYGFLKKEGVYFETISKFEELPLLLEKIVSKLPEYKNKANLNSEKAWEFGSWESNLVYWNNLYEQIFNPEQ